MYKISWENTGEKMREIQLVDELDTPTKSKKWKQSKWRLLIVLNKKYPKFLLFCPTGSLFDDELPLSLDNRKEFHEEITNAAHNHRWHTGKSDV